MSAAASAGMSEQTFTEQVSGGLRRLSHSALFRLAAAGLLVLVLQIPIGLIAGTVDERRERRDEAIAEVTQTWGGPQELAGPVLSIPFVERWVEKDQTHTRTVFRHVLPRDLRIAGQAPTERRRRGIFDVPLYVAELRLEGSFVVPNEEAFPVREVQWNRAQVAIGLSDVRAIRVASPLRVGADQAALQPGPGDAAFLISGLHAPVPTKAGATITFSVALTFGGHGRLSFVPMGDDTRVQLRSPWPHPSFDGAALPIERGIDASGFGATWRTLHLGRNFPSSWDGDRVTRDKLSASAVGVTLLAPVDTYRINDRAVKYQLLFLGLTFLAFSLFELLAALRVHPIQYLLVGFALCLFYLLLLSLSEHFGFVRAYITAASATVALVGGYVRVVLGRLGRGLAVGGLLAALYGFLFVLLQIEGYALLVGSVGLFFVLAVVMTLTRHVNWYALRPAPEEP